MYFNGNVKFVVNVWPRRAWVYRTLIQIKRLQP